MGEQEIEQSALAAAEKTKVLKYMELARNTAADNLSEGPRHDCGAAAGSAQ